ncbi:MAG: transporter [Coxiellaceae bacterium]|nr:transporter [Coxiellaceae bacterium]
MSHKKQWKIVLIFSSIYLMTHNAIAETVINPCSGPTSLLNIIDRPTVGDSPCTVPYKKAVLELGYQYQSLRGGGRQQNAPDAEFRLGLPANNELAILLPNYSHQSINPSAGFSATTLGLKHQIGYTRNWITDIEGLFTLPTGSDAFGSHALGVAINGIAGYTINSAFNLTFMLGASSQTESNVNGGDRFSSINPDVVLTYTLASKVNLYGEMYGQTQTGSGAGSGFNCDTGFVFLPLAFFAVDLEFGQRMSGNLGGFNHYVGAGMSMLF